MAQDLTQEFPDWTTYDNWLIENNSKYAITELNEVNGKIIAVYYDKTEPDSGEKNT